MALLLDQDACAPLERLPDEIATLSGLVELTLAGNRVPQLAPLAGPACLQQLSLNHTVVTDLLALAGMRTLQWLWLVGSRMADLRPLARLPKLGAGPLSGWWFDATPAAESGPEKRRLSRQAI